LKSGHNLRCLNLDYFQNRPQGQPSGVRPTHRRRGDRVTSPPDHTAAADQHPL